MRLVNAQMVSFWIPALFSKPEAATVLGATCQIASVPRFVMFCRLPGRIKLCRVPWFAGS